MENVHFYECTYFKFDLFLYQIKSLAKSKIAEKNELFYWYEVIGSVTSISNLMFVCRFVGQKKAEK